MAKNSVYWISSRALTLAAWLLGQGHALFWGVYLLAATTFVLIGLELSVRYVLPRLTMAMGGTLYDYRDVVRSDGLGSGGMLKPDLRLWVKDGYGGRVWWHTNSLGFRNDYEVIQDPPSHTVRILSLGDSFTAGYRVGQHEIFSHRLERWLNRYAERSVQVLVSETEEPGTGLFYYLSHGRRLRPMIVLLGITLGNDIAQAYVAIDPHGAYTFSDGSEDTELILNTAVPRIGFRHGLETLIIPTDCLTATKVSSADRSSSIGATAMLESLATYRLIRDELMGRRLRHDSKAIASWYGADQAPRLFDPVNGLGMFLTNPPAEIHEAYSRLFRLLAAFRRAVEREGGMLLVLLFPQRFQVQPADWTEAVRAYSLRADCFDLDRPNREIVEFCLRNHIQCIDPTPAMRAMHVSNGRELYLPYGDMHWNAQGHATFFEVIKTPFVDLLLNRGAPMETDGGFAITH
jgi:hypothetical protein